MPRRSIIKNTLLAACFSWVLASCATIQPQLAPVVAQPKTPVARNFTSFSASLRCLDDLLYQARKPRVLISSTGIPDRTKKIPVGADDMLVNAINMLNRKSGAYIFVDQPLERANGQIVFLTRDKDDKKMTRPRYYIRGSISQLDSKVVDDEIKLDIDQTNAEFPLELRDLVVEKNTGGFTNNLSVVSVDLHLVQYPSRTVVPGGSVANSMVVRGRGFGSGASGLVNLATFNVDIQIDRIESQGQAVRNLVELGVIELLGRHAGVPYWECLKIRTSASEAETKRLERRQFATPKPVTVANAQTYLRRLGYYKGTSTGVHDLRTRNAVAKFQQDNRLIATGEIDFDLMERLRTQALGRPVQTENRTEQGNRYDPMPENGIGLAGKGATSRINRSLASLVHRPEKNRYSVGDVFATRVSPKADGFLACYHQSGNGPIVQVLPVNPSEKLRVTSGTILRVPARTAPFDVKFEKSGGEEAILCVLDQAKKPVTLAEARADAALGQISAQSFDALIAAYRKKGRQFVYKEVRKTAR